MCMFILNTRFYLILMFFSFIYLFANSIVNFLGSLSNLNISLIITSTFNVADRIFLLSIWWNKQIPEDKWNQIWTMLILTLIMNKWIGSMVVLMWLSHLWYANSHISVNPLISMSIFDWLRIYKNSEFY